MRQLITPILFAALAVASTTLVGCASQQRTNETSTTTKADNRPVQRSGWPGMSGGGMRWSSLAYPTGDASTSALGIEKGLPGEVRLNQPFDYKIVVTNLTSNTLTDVVVTDDPGDNLLYNSSTPAAQRLGDGTLQWALGTLGAKQSRTILVDATPTAEGHVGSCATVSWANLLCATVPVVQPKLSVTKSGPSEVLLCESIKYDFTVTNGGTGSLEGVTINDPLPQGLTTLKGDRNVTFNVGTLAPGKTKKFSATVKAARRGSYANKATASGDGLKAESGTVTTVVREPVLAITKTGPEHQFIGRTSTYTITVSNTGDGEARDVVVTDRISGGTFVSANNGGKATGNTVKWSVGTIAPNQSKRLSMTLKSDEPGEVCNTASASAFCAKEVTAKACTTYTGISAILLEVIDTEDPVQVGDQETYVITVTNQGSAPDTNITLIITLEANQRYVRSAGPTKATTRGNVITFTPLPRLGPKERATYRVIVDCVKAGDVRFKVAMNSDQLTRNVEETEATNVYE